jgi:two-component sensor histidine kinase
MPNGVRAFLYKALGARDAGRRSAASKPVPRWVCLAVGLAAAAGSLLLRYALVPVLGDNEPFVPLFPLILFATLFGGVWAGGACLIAGLIGAWYLFMGRPDTFELAPHELGGLVSALLAGGVMVALCVVLRQLIAETTAAAAHEHVVAREFAHRMRNTLTLVLAISRRTFTADRPLEAARRDFEDRVSALSAAHAALLDARGEDAPLQEVVTRTLAPFGYAPGDGRFAIGGPAVRLPPEAATALALALHELSTNATKYGALSAPGGRVEFRWRLTGRDRRDLRLSWRETGGPPVSQPERRGFGATLIESNLAQALGGTAMLDFAPEGVRAEIAARLD